MNRRIRDRMMTAEEAARSIRSDMWIVAAGFRHPYEDSQVLRAASSETLEHPVSKAHPATAQHWRWHKGWKGPDLAILQAAAVFTDGFVPANSIENSAILAEAAHGIILEWNENWPTSLIGMHDFYLESSDLESHSVPLRSPTERIGTPYIELDWSKVIAVVKTDTPLIFPDPPAPTQTSARIAEHLIEFLASEVRQGRLTDPLPPLQISPGEETRAFLRALAESHWNHISLFTDVLEDSVFDLAQTGHLSHATASTLAITRPTAAHLQAHLKALEESLVLRPREVMTDPNLLRKLHILSINTASEIDFHGNAKLADQTWGTAGVCQDFARQSQLSIVLIPSSHQEGTVSQIVNVVLHPDLSARDVDVVISECGVADLRGIAPEERALSINQHCVHPNFQTALHRLHVESAF